MNAEIPGCLFVQAHSSRYRQRPQAQQNGPYDLILIHITDGHGIAQDTAEDWQKPGGTSAHIAVGRDRATGEIIAIQAVPLRFAAQHAHDCNPHSVGIEHGCRSPGELGPHDPGLPPTDALYQKSATIVAYLLKAAGLPPDRKHVQGHKEADPKTTHDDCPDGCGWDWDKYMTMVRKAYEQIGQPPAVV